MAPTGTTFVPPSIAGLSTTTPFQKQNVVAAVTRNVSSQKTTTTARFKKAPDAPKRFKSAFIIFSAEKHKKIKAKFAEQGRSEKTTDIAKLVSEAWREMPPEEREGWEEKARQDKARYEMERSLYKGPWKIPANKRTPKDPSAPKRPMSAFLAYSNKRRAALKRQHPDATNADLSKMLSKTWKELSMDLKSKYMEEEAELRAKYKVEMAKWRKKVAEEKKAERKEREAMALQAAEARQNDPGLMMSDNTQTTSPGQQQAHNSNNDMSGAAFMSYPYAAAGMPPNYATGAGDNNNNMMGSSQGFQNLMAANPFAAQQLLGGAATQQQLLQQLLGTSMSDSCLFVRVVVLFVCMRCNENDDYRFSMVNARVFCCCVN